MTTNRAILQAIVERMGQDNVTFKTLKYLNSLIAQSATKEAPGGRSGIGKDYTAEELERIMNRILETTKGRSRLPKIYGLTPPDFPT